MTASYFVFLLPAGWVSACFACRSEGRQSPFHSHLNYARVPAGYLAAWPSLLSGIRTSTAPTWQIGVLVLGLAAIIFVGLYLSQLERRHPIVHYRPRPSAVHALYCPCLCTVQLIAGALLCCVPCARSASGVQLCDASACLGDRSACMSVTPTPECQCTHVGFVRLELWR